MADLEKQTLLIELLLGNPDLFARCNAIIKPRFFDASLKKSVAFIQEYFESYKELPSKLIISAETGFKGEIHSLSKGEQNYVATEVEEFCKNKAIEEAILAGPALLEKGDFESIWQQIREATQISLTKDLGISYFDNVKERLRDLLTNSPVMLTGWKDVDNIIGGISRQELVLFAANSGVGKSITMSNLAVNLMEQGYNGVYISLELADRVVCKRFDSMTTGYSQAEILQKIDAVTEAVAQFKSENAGELFVKRMPESITTANHIRAYLKEFEQTHGFTPDFVIVDYLDLMASNRNISAENIWLADKYKSEELRSIGADFDCSIITASQLGRGALDAEKVGQQHIQGGISKIQSCDVMISIIQSDQMRSAGEFLFDYTKTRNSNGVGQQTILKWDPISLRISNMPETQLKFIKKPLITNSTVLDTNNTIFDKEPSDKLDLLQLMSSKK